MLCDKTWPNWVGMPKEGLKELLKVIDDVCAQSFYYSLTGLLSFLEAAVLFSSEFAKYNMVLHDDVKLTRPLLECSRYF